MTIQEKCDKLNRDIHNPLFLNYYLSNNQRNHERAFTSIDLIEDCQNAIEEFEGIPEANIQGRSTLYIYGVLQSLYCQQDGLLYLYETIIDSTIKNPYDLFRQYSFNKEIREVRDDIAGHPANRDNRNKGKEFYFIEKGSTSKYIFSYAGYTPKFRKVDVNLKQFMEEQERFTKTVLDDIENAISKKLQAHKNKFRTMKLLDTVKDIDNSIQLIQRGISNNHPLAACGVREIKEKLDKLKEELNSRYNNEIHVGIQDIFLLQYHILNKIESWISNGELHSNIDAKIFMAGFENQMQELNTQLKGIDDDFES